MVRLRRLVLHRLLSYYRLLTQWTEQKEIQSFTSAKIGEALDIDPTQVRKDLGSIGVKGVGRVGFDVEEVSRVIREVLGIDHGYQAVLVGSGHLGAALLAYKGFRRYGLEIVAAFDSDESKVGTEVGGVIVKPMQVFKSYIMRHNIRLAILTTPVEVSQKLTDRLVSAGVTAIWNFSPISLSVPEGVLVRDEYMSTGLSEIAYHLSHQ